MQLITEHQGLTEPRWFMVEIREAGQASQPESYPEEELRRLFPMLAPLLDDPRFEGCRWEAIGAGGLQTIRISVDA